MVLQNRSSFGLKFVAPVSYAVARSGDGREHRWFVRVESCRPFATAALRIPTALCGRLSDSYSK